MQRQRNWRLLAALVLVLAFLSFGYPAAYGASFDQNQAYIPPAEAPASPSGDYSAFGILLKIVGSLAVIVLGGYLAMRFMQKKLAPGVSPSAWMRVVDQLPLGPNKGLYITEIGGRFFVMGVSEDSIQKIMEIEDPVLIDELQRQEGEEPPEREDWWQRIKGMLASPAGMSPNRPEERLSFHQEMNRQLSRLSRLSGDGVKETFSPRGREEDR